MSAATRREGAPSSLTPQQVEAYVDAAAAALALPLQPAHRPGVLRYFALAAEMADAVNQFPLDVQDEPAPAFIPVSPAERPA